MAPKKQVLVHPLHEDDQSEAEPETEELEVQVKQAMRKKGVAGHVENGKKMQAKGVEARKQNGFASQREKKLAAEQKKNDRLERLRKIDDAEEAERERSERLAGEKREKTKEPKVPIHDTIDPAPNFDSRLARIEELLQARQAEVPAKSKKKPPAKKAVRQEEESSEEDQEVPPRQKQVRKSAKTEMKKKSGAIEEDIHTRGHMFGNTGKQKAILIDQNERYKAMARNLMPGMF